MEKMSMRRRIMLPMLLVGIAASLCACGASRPVGYYVLDVDPPTSTTAQPLPVTLLVGRFTTSELYRQDRLVYGSGPVELGTYEYERWAESPADMVQDMLITSLRASGQYRSVSRMTSSLRADYVVRGRLFGLDEVDKPRLAGRFSVEIDLFDPKTGMTVWSDTYTHEEPASGKKVADVVAALDKTVGVGMQQITSEIGQYISTHLPAQAAAH
jgi:ABC-type uncharacterized transport system auxiliary subunit